MRGCVQLCRKDLLAKNIKRTKRAVEKEAAAGGASGRDEAALAKYDFAPITFILPMDYALFVEVSEDDRTSRATHDH